MENKIMMPASYNVLSCEEMTYTEGGATVGQAVAAWLWPGYATVIGINTCREARKKDHDALGTLSFSYNKTNVSYSS